MDDDSVTSETKQCPWCAETILAAARKCKHCGEYIDGGHGTSDTTGLGAKLPEIHRDSPRSSWTNAILSGLTLVVLAGGTFLGLWIAKQSSQPTSRTESFDIPSSSMYPTLKVGDIVTVQLGAYDSTSPETGDVIVFRAPPAARTECDSPQLVDLLKRIIGTPGETIWSAGNVIYVDGQVLDQTWMHVNPIGQAIRRQTIPANDYFVMGDNHPGSCDSRVWGYVARASISGRATHWTSTSASGSL